MSKNRALRSLIYKSYDTEAQMARKMGWSRQKLSNITNGRKIPNVNEVSELADALDASISSIAGLFLP